MNNASEIARTLDKSSEFDAKKNLTKYTRYYDTKRIIMIAMRDSSLIFVIWKCAYDLNTKYHVQYTVHVLSSHWVRAQFQCIHKERAKNRSFWSIHSFELTISDRFIKQEQPQIIIKTKSTEKNFIIVRQRESERPHRIQIVLNSLIRTKGKFSGDHSLGPL